VKTLFQIWLRAALALPLVFGCLFIESGRSASARFLGAATAQIPTGTYDEQSQGTLAYDGEPCSPLTYDWGVMLLGNECRKPLLGNLMPFGSFSGILAAERTPAENAIARNKFKNNKDAARQAWENLTGKDWPENANGQPWPAEHTPPLKSGGDPMTVTPRDPGAPDPHNIPGSDGLTDYQRWGAQGTPARQANQ
jgi:hypothetical protein